MKNRRLPYAEQLEMQIYNTLEMLYQREFLYTYNALRKEWLDRDTVRLSWNNHVSGSFNTGDYFLRIRQYRQIIENKSYLCILFDGSLIRVSYTIQKDILTAHSLLWWPAPYKYKNVSLDDVEPVQMLSDFLSDKEWYENIEMRSPIRIDYDPKAENTSLRHPPVHMHFEHKDCRIFVNRPLCFNRFIKYIFENFYPHCPIYLDENDYIEFMLEDPIEDAEGITKLMCD